MACIAKEDLSQLEDHLEMGEVEVEVVQDTEEVVEEVVEEVIQEVEEEVVEGEVEEELLSIVGEELIMLLWGIELMHQ
ncbi:Primary amine oxidase, liver isozyme [Frankliniella fusca]|uniref:Primary amine oxidase, liver isozyme n=1 Tax=Frankliniella fusca TaxID=407009 RepID=A0AAE1I5H4_9NEOP|nr:Primary amine oxidase, liver isozyme [Frankliniella fusca]